MINVVICGAAALLPSIFLLRYFIKSDRFPEPTDVLMKTFFYGILIALPVIVAEFLVSMAFEGVGGPATQALINAFLVAALCEEAFKFLVLHRYCARHEAFDEPMDAVVYGAVASLGFATLENVLYVSEGGMATAVVRAFTAVPAHASFGALMGYYYAKVHFNQNGRPNYVAALLTPIIVHGLYDAFIFLGEVQWIKEMGWPAAVLLMCFLGLLGWMYVRTKSIVVTLRADQNKIA